MDGVIVSGAFGRAAVLRMQAPLVTHAHAQPNLLFKLGGDDAGFVVGGRRVALSDGQGVLVNAMRPHSFVAPPRGAATEVLTIHLDPVWLKERGLTVEAAGPDRLFGSTSVILDRPLRRALGRISERLRAPCMDAHGVIAPRLGAILDDLMDRVGPRREPAPRTDARIRCAMTLIAQDLSRELSMDAIARTVGLSRTAFYEAFRRSAGMTPEVFANMKRVEAAIAGMRGPATLAGIGYDLGFSAPPHFTRFFRSNVGIAPSAFRERLVNLGV